MFRWRRWHLPVRLRGLHNNLCLNLVLMFRIASSSCTPNLAFGKPAGRQDLLRGEPFTACMGGARSTTVLHPVDISFCSFLSWLAARMGIIDSPPRDSTPASNWFRSVVFIPNIARSRLFIIRSAQFGSSSLFLYCSLLSPLAIEPSRSVGSRKVRYHHGYHARVFSLSNPSPGGVEEILIQDLPP